MTQTAVMFRCFPGAGLAQLVERWFCKPDVAGSNPAPGTIFNKPIKSIRYNNTNHANGMKTTHADHAYYFWLEFLDGPESLRNSAAKNVGFCRCVPPCG